MKDIDRRIVISIFLCLLGIVWFAMTTPVLANSMTHHMANSVSDATQQVALIEQKNQLAAENYKKLSDAFERLAAAATPVTKEDIERAELESALASANIDAATIAKAEAQQNKEAIVSRMKELETQLQGLTLAAGTTHSVSQRLEKLQVDLNHQSELAKAQEEQIAALDAGLQWTKQTYDLRERWKNTLLTRFNAQEQAQRELALEQQERSLQQQQRQWLERLAALNNQLQPTSQGASVKKRLDTEEIELQILQAQENSNLIHLQLVFLHAGNVMAGISQNLTVDQSLMLLNSQISQMKVTQKELSSVSALMEQKINLLTQRQLLEKERLNKGLISTASYNMYNQSLSSLLTQYQSYQQQLNQLSSKSDALLLQLQKKLKQSLARRQGLPGFSVQAWGQLGYKLMSMPGLIIKMVHALNAQVLLTFNKISLKVLLLTLLVEAGLFVLTWWLKTNLTLLVDKLGKDRRRISDNLRFVVLRLARCNLWGIYGVTAVFSSLWLLGVPFKSVTPILWLAMVGLIFKMLMTLARIVLIETTAEAAGRDIKLYNHLRWALWGGAVLTMMTVLAQRLPVGLEARDFFNRLFALFLLLVAVLLLRGWNIVPYLLASYVDRTRPYVMSAVKLFCFLVPLTLLITALIGFFGYVDLAWTISRYEGKFLLVLISYVLLHGFLTDFLDWLSEFLIRHLRNGWLWTQAVLKPLDKILQIGLFIAAVATLFFLYGWGRDSAVVQALLKFMKLHLLELKGTVITPMGLIEFTITGFVLYWVSRWTREFAYRWMFARTSDVGLRNSLAAFTQYSIVVVGFFIALKIIGIDLSGIEYILGGFAIAAGFGMRDLLKNYASGLLLLIERPVRTGDLVSIGSFEGEVTRIGMRSMTVKTWDHMEVLVPNSETFDKPFTNWTHQDGIVRTVISLKFDRKDDPNFVREVIFSVLKHHPQIVSLPEPEVLMIQLNEYCFDLDVRYFINLHMGSSRVVVRSEVLFTLWAAFKFHNITPPHPQQDIHVRTLPEAEQEVRPYMRNLIKRRT